MTPLHRTLARGLVVAAVLFGVMVAPATTSADENCSHGWVRFHEDANLGGDAIAFCVDDADLGNNAHTPSGLCNGPIIINDSWNNCISSFWIILTSGHCFQMYNNAGYTSTIGPRYWGPLNASYNITGLWNDSVSSFRFGTTNATC